MRFDAKPPVVAAFRRKITNAPDRKKLKEIAPRSTCPKGAGLICAHGGSPSAPKTEIKRDYEYLQRLWEQIRELTLKSTAPAQIYDEEGNLIKRSIRDLYNREIDEVLVEGADGHTMAKDFMKMIMPSHAKNVQLYTDPQPLVCTLSGRKLSGRDVQPDGSAARRAVTS